MALRQLVGIHAVDILEHEENNNNNYRRLFHQRDDPFHLRDNDFIKQFRLSKEMVRTLINLVEELSDPVSRRSALNAKIKVFTALKFYASGSYQLDIGSNKYIGVSQASVSRCIRDISTVLNNPVVFNEWVHFPNNFEELRNIRNAFYEELGFPGVVGCIDCTHVAIVPPNTEDELYPEHIYVNRKGYHLINTQLICDSKMKILNVNSRYPGSTHDSFIWNHNNVLPLMQNLHARGHENFYLLGDSGYALRPWLLTTLHEAEPNTSEERYNQCFWRTRAIVERCNGLLKMRFRCLLKHRVLHYAPHIASKVINACTVLHNMCVENNLPAPENENDDIDFDFGMEHEIAPQEAAVGRVNHHLMEGKLKQRQLIRNYFYN